MKCYLVGGAVRDRLLGGEPKDLDYVVVGATPADMLAAGYRAIDAEFPIFVDTKRREFALARQERKTGPGHRGFQVEFGPEVTLEEDLGRRDLTVNAMAIDTETGEMIDPYGGQVDLAACRLRHVSAEAFIEDPLRALRVARFLAQLPTFSPERETMALVQTMAERGLLGELTPERVFGEVERALLAEWPSRFFLALHLRKLYGNDKRLLNPAPDTPLKAVLPEVDAIWGVPEPPQHHPEQTTWWHTMLVVDWLAAAGVRDPVVLWAGLCHDLGKAFTPLADLPRHPGHEKASARVAKELLTRLRAPRAQMEAVVALSGEHMRGKRWREMRAGRVLRLLRELGALRDPQRLPQFLLLLEADLRGRGNAGEPVRRAEIDTEVAETGEFYRCALGAALSVRGAEVIADLHYAGKAPGPWVGEVVVQRQVAAIKAATKGMGGIDR